METLSAAEQVLVKYVPLASQAAGKNMTLTRMSPLLVAVGSPHERLRAIHIAGTSGKTSTAYFISELLRLRGVSVGMTVSPHIDGVNERVQINGRPLEEKEFCAKLEQFIELVEIAGIKPTYFELIMAFAFWTFDKFKTEYAVIETGLGGQYDASNVLNRPDKLCVITDIGLDHTAILGNSLAEIAQQKAGIIHNGNHVFCHNQPKIVMKAISDRLGQQTNRLHVVDEPLLTSDSTTAAYQLRNWNLANKVVDFIASRDDLGKLSNQELKNSLINVPGRMEIISAVDQVFVLDGAHNPQKTNSLVESFKKSYPGHKVPILVAMKTDKDSHGVLEILSHIASEFIFSSLELSQDLPTKFTNPKRLLTNSRDVGVHALAIPNLNEALSHLVTANGNLKLITGSLYLLGPARSLIRALSPKYMES